MYVANCAQSVILLRLLQCNTVNGKQGYNEIKALVSKLSFNQVYEHLPKMNSLM
jgi:hypothetical protein